jgi:hypothetical protein
MRTSMPHRPTEPRNSREVLAFYAVLAVGVAMAIVSARDLAGGWNDGSRLATVEALVDYHTLAIDDSIFVKVPWPDYYAGASTYGKALVKHKQGDPFPYPLEYPRAWIGDGQHPETMGTHDKVLIGGHYYSHKPPVPAVLMAPWYFVVRQLSGLKAHDRYDEFCYWMTLGSSGVAYVVTLLCLFQLGGVLGVALPWRLALVASLGFSTVTVAYVRNVNDHILLLAVASGMALALAHLARSGPKHRPAKLMAVIGGLAGMGYTIDQATGPAMLLATVGLVAFRVRRQWLAWAVFAAAALPWLVLHHAINYAIGGTFKSIGMVPEFFDWPGSSFDRGNMTGFWNHKSLAEFGLYLFNLTIRPFHGFVAHNLPLLAVLPGVFVLWRRHAREWPELIWGAGWCLLTWLVYGALSNNYSGDCCSIRWFVPFLAVGYYFLAVLVGHDHRYQAGLLLFSGLGAALAYFMWQQGPWLEAAGDPIDGVAFQLIELAGLAIWPLWTVWTWWKGYRHQG